jgi:hypothetical protein
VVFRLCNDEPVRYVWLPPWLVATSLGAAAVVWLAWVAQARDLSATRGYLVLLTWLLPYFVLTGGWKAQYVRYTALLVPVLCIFAGAMVSELSQPRRGAVVRATVATATAAVIVASALYSCAFARIYVSPHTRIAASQWIYMHLPDGARILNEHHDETVPVQVAGMPPKEFNTTCRTLNARYFRMWEPRYFDPDKFNVQEPDLLAAGDSMLPNGAKLEYLCGGLASADYVVTSSSRRYGAVLAVPERYPITALYYKLLFSGELGYRHVATISSRPRLAGFEIVDDLAEESFLSFDHPKINVFANQARLDAVQLMQRFRNPPIEARRLSRSQIILRNAGPTDTNLFSE